MTLRSQQLAGRGRRIESLRPAWAKQWNTVWNSGRRQRHVDCCSLSRGTVVASECFTRKVFRKHLQLEKPQPHLSLIKQKKKKALLNFAPWVHSLLTFLWWNWHYVWRAWPVHLTRQLSGRTGHWTNVCPLERARKRTLTGKLWLIRLDYVVGIFFPLSFLLLLLIFEIGFHYVCLDVPGTH